MNKYQTASRQVHLDFHTSEKIQGIAEAFDAEEFALTLEQAKVNSITCFARCHHGWLYYDSKLFPERIHPNLKNKNLLKEQIEACRKRGIKVPIYITVQWDNYTAEHNPEWLAMDQNGNFIETFPCNPGFYRALCLNTGYRDFLKEQTREVLEMFHPVDGLFFDIVFPVDCNCHICKSNMDKLGFDSSNKKERFKYSQLLMDEFKCDMTDFIRSYNKNCGIFYNTSHVGTAQRKAIDCYSHFELESLPSGGWGYMHFPITARYARNFGLNCVGMTGKFHTYWGDFHSFKNKAALEFECFNMLALNAKCSIGDQLDPNGKISKPVYELIGSVYSQVKKKEPWCIDAKAVTDIGVFTPEEFYEAGNTRLSPAMIGVTRMLQEAGHQFDVIDSSDNFYKYKVLILPDNICVETKFANKLKGYINSGGRVIASFESGLELSKSRFAIDLFGVEYKGKAPYSPDFIVPQNEIGYGLYNTEYVMYLQGLEVKPIQESEVLAYVNIPYFNRTEEHYCSHQHTPSSGKIGYPGIIKNGEAIYFAHPIFTQYSKNGSGWCKRLFLNALKMLLPEPLVRHNGPSTMIATLNEQAKEKRWILHLLHYIPEKRCEDIHVIEDVIPLYNIDISMRTSSKVKKLSIVPDMEELKFNMRNERLLFTLPKLNGHSMISIEFEDAE
ncbi:alpha-amylase family protein [Brassicibacter mesophilus]|uniref:alpha-amylase family protein n=1 Tax=Brassicibacter mesophilus TaxID=745119 RepID=UPI003D1F07FA